MVPVNLSPKKRAMAAVAIAYELGKSAINGCHDGMTDRRRKSGGQQRRVQLKADAAVWHAEVRPIWWEKREQFPQGDPRRRRLSQERLAMKIVEELKGKVPGLPGYDQVLWTIKMWEKEQRAR
jgi:hypothetical protein